MKRVMFIAMTWLAVLPVIAQPAAGKLFIGGQMSAYGTANKSKSGSTTEKDGSTTYLSLMPTAGYYLNNRIAVGAGIGFETQINKDPRSAIDKSTTSEFVFSPYGRYYLISGTGGLFAEASVGLSFGSNKTYTADATDTEKVMDFSLLLSPGVYYYITPKLALEAKFGWFGFRSDVSKPTNDIKDTQNTFGVNLSPDSFVFGLTFTL